MSSQLVRVASFASWPVTAAVSSLALAKAGFKYSGHGESTVCADCQLVIDHWQLGDRPDQVHCDRSPGCRYVCENLIAISSAIEYDDVEVVTRSRDFVDSRLHTAANELSHSVNRSQPDFELLKNHEEMRLSTFHNWPERAARIVSPSDLAKAGMFYTGVVDRVQCAFCRGYLRNWVQGDIPADEHRKNFPDCTQARDQRDHVGLQSGRAYMTSSSAQNVPVRSESPVSTGVQPKHPNYATEQRRIQSFNGVRLPHFLSAELLAKAGFFYVGPNDNVRCYCCDGGLKNWQPTDNPWSEHRRWFPRCPYVLSAQNVPEMTNQSVAHNIESSNNPSRAQTTNLRPSASNVEYRVEPREIKARLDAPVVQAVINMGYNRNLVRKVIEQRLLSTGDDFPNAHSLLEAVFALEEEMAQQEPTQNFQAASGAAAAVNIKPDATSSTPVNAAASNASSATEHIDDYAANSNDAIATEQATSVKPKSRRKKKKSGKSASSGELTGVANAKADDTSNAPTVSMSDLSVPTTYMLEENEKLREERTCKVCMDSEVNTVFLPCGHFVCCASCAQQLQRCPICRNCISGTVRATIA